jgi:hypothetical protein
MARPGAYHVISYHAGADKTVQRLVESEGGGADAAEQGRAYAARMTEILATLRHAPKYVRGLLPHRTAPHRAYRPQWVND